MQIEYTITKLTKRAKRVTLLPEHAGEEVFLTRLAESFANKRFKQMTVVFTDGREVVFRSTRNEQPDND